MAAKTPAKAKADEPNLPAVISEDEFAAALQQYGFLPTSTGGSDFNRLTVKGTNIYAGDEIIAAYNQKTKEPALIVQLAGPPKQKQSLWMDKDGVLVDYINTRLGDNVQVAGRFCESHFDDPQQARRYAANGASCDECPVHPFVPKKDLPEEANGRQCAWKADIEFFILTEQEDGTYKCEDGVLWTMTLPTTAVIEFVGSSSKKKGDNLAGAVSQFNTNVQIAKLGAAKWGLPGIQKARTYQELGGVIAELHILAMTNADKSRSWNIPSFRPIDIIEVEEQPQLETSEPVGDVSTDDIPF